MCFYFFDNSPLSAGVSADSHFVEISQLVGEHLIVALDSYLKRGSMLRKI
jgi:hypothetical protein